MPFKQAFTSPPWKDIDVNAPLWAPQYTVAAFFLLWLYIPGKYLKMMENVIKYEHTNTYDVSVAAMNECSDTEIWSAKQLTELYGEFQLVV